MNKEVLESAYLNVLKEIGEDPAREGLQKTPERMAKAMKYLVKGYGENPEEILACLIVYAQHH